MFVNMIVLRIPVDLGGEYTTMSRTLSGVRNG